MICSYSPTSGVFGDGRKPRVNNKLFYVLSLISFTPRKPKRANVKKKKNPPTPRYAYIPHVLIAFRRIFDKKSWETMLGCTQPFASVPACLCIGNILILST